MTFVCWGAFDYHSSCMHLIKKNSSSDPSHDVISTGTSWREISSSFGVLLLLNYYASIKPDFSLWSKWHSCVEGHLIIILAECNWLKGVASQRYGVNICVHFLSYRPELRGGRYPARWKYYCWLNYNASDKPDFLFRLKRHLSSKEHLIQLFTYKA